MKKTYKKCLHTTQKPIILPSIDMATTVPIRKNKLLKITVFVFPVAPTVPVYPTTVPITAKLQAQVKTLIAPKRKTAARAIIPVWSVLKIELIHSFIVN